MNYLIAGGGTGGHIFPAIAIGEALKKKVQGAKVYYVGTRYGMEYKLMPDMGYPLLTLPIRGLLGKNASQKLGLLWRLPASLLLSLILLIRFRPKVVIGVGGYASAPLMLTAGLLRIPTMIQEQNAIPGMTNKLSSKTARLACCGFPQAKSHFKCPAIVTGNPVRGDFSNAKPWSSDRKTVLVLGGSQGAAALNEQLPKLLKENMPRDVGVKVVHQCGERQLEAVKQAYEKAAFHVEVTAFIDNMGQLLEHVLFAVCRAGASTIAELKMLGIPAILVPFPKATHDHQTHNARSLADLGAALLVPEHELPECGPILLRLLTDSAKLEALAAAYPKQARNSAELCADIALALQQRREVTEIVREFETHVS